MADQLYSLILTAVIGVRDRSAPARGLEFTVAIGRTRTENGDRSRLDIIRVRVWSFITQFFLTFRLVNPALLNMPSPVSKPRTLYDKIWDDHVMYVTLSSCDRPILIPIHLQVTYRMMGSP